MSFGAYVNAVSHPDPVIARELVRGSLTVFTRFSGMERGGQAGLSGADLSAVRDTAAAYDTHSHASRFGADVLDAEFVSRFAVIGSPGYCVDRLGELVALGLDHLVIASHSRDADPARLAEASEVFGSEVIPYL